MRYVKQFTMTLGNVTTVGSLSPIRASSGGKFKLCTKDYRPVHQVYMDDDGVKIEREDLCRGIPVKDSYTLLPVGDNEALAEAKRSKLEKNTLILTAHNASDVNQYLYPSDNQGYVFEPMKLASDRVVADPANDLRCSIINILLRDANVALIGRANLQGHEGLFRLGLFQGYITVQKQLYPEELNEFDPCSTISDPALEAKAKELAAKIIEDFRPEDYENQIKKRLDMIANGDWTSKPVDPVLNLLDEMEKMLG